MAATVSSGYNCGQAKLSPSVAVQAAPVCFCCAGTSCSSEWPSFEDPALKHSGWRCRNQTGWTAAPKKPNVKYPAIFVVVLDSESLFLAGTYRLRSSLDPQSQNCTPSNIKKKQNRSSDKWRDNRYQRREEESRVVVCLKP